MRQLGQSLPLHLARPFRQWLYTVSHRTLILRSHGRADPGHGTSRSEESVDVVFVGVLAMNTRVNYRELFIAIRGDLTEVDGFTEVPERHRHRYVCLTVSDGTHDGFVVCANLGVDPVGEAGLRRLGRARDPGLDVKKGTFTHEIR
ncbi:hypothetical protein [Catellatospora vulcania]|uniref:hypothetical protein n=1 Tax=Catellatospora vulcania TaxID=1460450 RepID=UPI0018AFC9C3|nr:hypothetical protein [Catellatospora vulcania]